MSNLDNILSAIEITPEFLEQLELRYTWAEVPPCRVCGAELEISRMGGGNATKYNCSQAHVNGFTSEASEHWAMSEWRQLRPGDTCVLALIRAYREKVV